MPMIPQISYPFMCIDAWMKIIRGLPSAKPVGPCGWLNDELKRLPKCCIQDLVWIFERIAVTGFSSSLMIAKAVLLAKIPVPLSLNHARPITILSCLYRLFGRFAFRHTAQVWKVSRNLPTFRRDVLKMPLVLETRFGDTRWISSRPTTPLDVLLCLGSC